MSKLHAKYARSNKRNCGSKKAFSSFREAAEFNKPIRRRHIGKKIEKLHIYRCKHCDQFHLGHEPRQKQKYLPN